MPTDRETAAARYFTGELNRLRDLGGRLSYARLSALTDHPRSTLAETLGGQRRSLADWPFYRPLVLAFIKVARDNGHENAGTEDEWRAFWRAACDGTRHASPLLSHLRREKARKERQRAAILEGEGVNQTLRALYPDYPLVDLWGVQMPICEFPAHPQEYREIESPIGALLNRDVPAYDDYSGDFDPSGGRSAFLENVARYRAADEEDRRRFFPGATYALHKMEFTSRRRVVLHCVMGRYFTSLATSEDLDMEMMEALAADPGRPVPLNALKRRAWLHEQVEDPVLDGRHRAAAVSHATVIMSATGDGGHDIFLPERSRDVATHAEFNHVAPSGIFAPYDESTPSPSDEFSVRRNFYREWVEELYGLEEHERPPAAFEIPDPEDEPEITRLRELIASGGADLYYTGVSYNLLTMRPEICLLLLINDPEWRAREARIARQTSRPFKLGWEYAQGPWEGRKAHGQPEEARLRLDHDLRPAGQWRLKPSFLIPNAAAAISLAIRAIRSMRAAQGRLHGTRGGA